MTAVSHPPSQQQHVYHQGQTSGPGPSSINYGHHQQQGYMYPNGSHSIMEDLSDDESDQSDEGEEEDEFDGEPDPEQQRFYEQQQRQSQIYMQHQQQNGNGPILGQAGSGAGGSNGTGKRSGGGGSQSSGMDDEDSYSDDDESSAASIPDENIDPGLTYALHTFLATVEGQASVVKGDSLLLLDDTNAYWWLVRVLKTEDVGYIPAENIETPYERLARLNKHRNVDLAHPTMLEKAEGEAQGRERMKAGLLAKKKGKPDRSDSGTSDEPRRVIFAPPTYVEPSIRTWSSDEEGGSGDDEESGEEEDEEPAAEEGRGREAEEASRQQQAQSQVVDMEPDDGMEWADGAGQEDQRRIMEQKQVQQTRPVQSAPVTTSTVQPKSNNPFASQRQEPVVQPEVRGLDPAQAGETRRITVTPTVAQGGQSNGVLLPSAVMNNNQRNVSASSGVSVMSTVSTAGSISGESTGTNDDRKSSKMRKSTSQDSLGSEKGDKKEKKRSMLGGLFSRKGKEKKGISSSDPRTSEDSMVSGTVEGSPGSIIGRKSEESGITVRAPTPSDRQPQSQPYDPSQSSQPPHSLRLQQQDQATMQAYSSKYLKASPTNADVRSPTASEAAVAVAQSAAAMRLSATMNGVSKHRPSSIIISPNPAAPLLNVMRIFAGEHIKSDASFKTVLLNDTTTSTDLIRQVMQRFRIHVSSGSETSFFLTVKDVNGEEMELEGNEKPLSVFLDTVQRCTEEDGSLQTRSMTPTVKRSSVSSISSLMSLSSHPAIAKLGMNDFSDDSIVKIYLNRRRPGSTVVSGKVNTMENSSELGSYSSQLSTVLESSPENNNRRSGVWSNDDSHSEIHDTPPQPHSMRYNPSLSISTKGEASPERFSSPSARFTIQILLHFADLPDGSVFDPVNDAIISRQVLRDRLTAGHPSQGSRDLSQDKRKRLFMLPRNATVVEAIEQGLERFGIQGGVVDGGDDVEERGGKRGGTKFRYSLVAINKGKERELPPSSKLLDSYSVPPTLKPVERTTPEQRRRSREWSYNIGTAADILPSDPIFILRRSGSRHPPSSSQSSRSVLQQQQQQSFNSPHAPSAPLSDPRNGAKSPQEIIAAQRAASRATQKALISAHANKNEGIDLVLPNKQTLRSSRLLEPTGDEVVRYSFIDDDGSTYDISELLEEEWGQDGTQASPHITQSGGSLRPPAPYRQGTDQSIYTTAPSTPEPGVSRELADAMPSSHAHERRGSTDILRGVFERSAGRPEGKLEEKIARVIEKVKNGNVNGNGSRSSIRESPPSPGSAGRTIPIAITQPSPAGPIPSGRTTSSSSSASTHALPSSRALSPLLEGQQSGSPSSTNPSRSNSRQGSLSQSQTSTSLQNTAASVNRIISRHKQQPSIASIMSDLSGHQTQDPEDDMTDRDVDRGDRDGNITPATATSSSHPTPPLGTSIYMRAVNSTSPTPRVPVRYTDDFGMKTLMGLVEARAREMRPKVRTNGIGKLKKGSWSSSIGSEKDQEGDEIMRVLWGEKVGREEMEGMNPDIRACLGRVQSRLDAWDLEVDEILATLGGGGR